MARKRLTQIFPFLLPLRVWQRNLFYRIRMKLDKNKYAYKTGALLPNEVSSSKTLMINQNSGQDIIYQKNKVDNLKILSKTMNKIIIYPGETFSFYYLAKNSSKYGEFKEGLILIDNKLVAKKGGGICHLSNLLYYVFLMSPLTPIERHGHKIKSFPNPDKDSLDGIDATINMGWLDLKVRNDTTHLFQILIEFEKDYMIAKILSDKSFKEEWIIINDNFKYLKKNNKIFESIDVVKITRDKETKKELKREKLYNEIVEVNYKLPLDVIVEEIN